MPLNKKRYVGFKLIFDRVSIFQAPTCTIALDQSEPGRNSNEEYFRLPRALEVKSHHQIQFSFIPRTALFEKCLTPRQGRQSLYSKLC